MPLLDSIEQDIRVKVYFMAPYSFHILQLVFEFFVVHLLACIVDLLVDVVDVHLDLVSEVAVGLIAVFDDFFAIDMATPAVFLNKDAQNML